jgi:hypothetical protein
MAGEPATQPGGDGIEQWRGVHLFAPDPPDIPLFKQAVSEVLAPLGCNVIVLEVGCKFQYASHPEVRAANALSPTQTRDLARYCRTHGIRLIPEFQCLGHQSWAKTTGELLTAHPEFDETPDIPKDNPGIYCRSWCPLHPKVNDVVFDLMDELIDAFQPDAFHVGMDEVFLIASDQCPRCRGQDPARLFAKAVNDYHDHLVGKRKLTMLMWGDRLLDAGRMGYDEWEASRNGTAPAIDLIPKDIIICDWHYHPRDEYPSIPFFQEKGFRVWPSSWWDPKAAEAMMDYALAHATDRMIGHLCTTWEPANIMSHALLGHGEPATDQSLKTVATLRACMTRLSSPDYWQAYSRKIGLAPGR